MEHKKEKINNQNENKKKFEQLIIKLNIGRYSFLENVRKNISFIKRNINNP